MKKLLIILCLAALAFDASAQGLVRFQNTDTTLVSVDGPYPTPPTMPLPAGAPGSYLFALMTAPAGDTILDDFRFTGNYATNTAEAGLLRGGAVVNGWTPGETRNFMVVGWPSFYGLDFGTVFGGLPVSSYGSYCSGIGTGAAGGVDPVTGGFIPALNIFGQPPSIGGFVIHRVPEPLLAALAGLAAAVLLVVRRRK